ncbi:hypothetical protein E2C01_071772 [Portunus trituberculatus]|uniref:Uncharacterized protein n=1 Tax=Portunus trituberculatus TaxID=210409 RepID=A0A5B7HXW5_PORTR|nr:hypothetical protein [Portunus trituberculatus]
MAALLQPGSQSLGLFNRSPLLEGPEASYFCRVWRWNDSLLAFDVLFEVKGSSAAWDHPPPARPSASPPPESLCYGGGGGGSNYC